LSYPNYFGVALLGIIFALALYHIALRDTHSQSALENAAASSPTMDKHERASSAWWAWHQLTVEPLALQFTQRQWGWWCRVWLIASLGLTLSLAYLSLRQGNPPVWLWLLTLLVVAAVWYCADRAAQRRSVLTRSEWFLLFGYIVGLLVLGYAYRTDATRWLAIVLGCVLAAWLWQRQPARRELIAVAVVVMLAFAVYTFDLTSWRYAFIGDEYSFYEFANNLIAGRDRPYPLRLRGAYDVHPVAATLTQVSTILLYGNDVYGWRISESLAVMLAALPLYVFMRSFTSSRAALLGLIAYLSSQHLLGLSKVGYTYSQLLVPITGGLALLVLAMRRGSWLGVFLSSVVATYAFYTFAFGIPFLALPLLLLGLYYMLDVRASRWLAPLAVFTIGVGLTAMPSLSDAEGLRQISLHTIAKTEVRADNIFTQQLLPNFLRVLTAPLTFLGHSHYVSGPHLDFVSSLLMLLGLGSVLLTWRKNRLAFWLLSSWLLACFFAGGLAPYPYPPIARTYILVPFYALFVAIGITQLTRGFASFAYGARSVMAVWLICALAIPTLNLYHFFVLTNRVNPQESVALLVKEFQTQPDVAVFYLVTRTPYNHPAARLVLRSYNLDPNKLVIIPDASPAASLAAIQRSRTPYVILLMWSMASRDSWRTAMRGLWTERTETLVQDDTQLTHFAKLRVDEASVTVSAKTTPQGMRRAPFSASAGLLPRIIGQWSVSRPRDVAISADEVVYVINGAQKKIEARTLAGQLLRALAGEWRDPYALAVNARNELLALDAAHPQAVTRLRPDGAIIARSGNEVGFSSPRGFAIAPNGDIYVADTGGGRIVRFNGELLEPRRITTTIPLQQPTSLTFVGDKMVVADAPMVYVFAPNGELLAQWRTTMFNTAQPPRFLAAQTQLIVMTDPEPGEIVFFDLQGRIVQTIGAPTHERLRKPQGIAATTDGRVFIADHEGDLVRVMDWSAP
jgi:hypothetical protein